jgi:hypothetical protein
MGCAYCLEKARCPCTCTQDCGTTNSPIGNCPRKAVARYWTEAELQNVLERGCQMKDFKLEFKITEPDGTEIPIKVELTPGLLHLRISVNPETVQPYEDLRKPLLVWTEYTLQLHATPAMKGRPLLRHTISMTQDAALPPIHIAPTREG